MKARHAFGLLGHGRAALLALAGLSVGCSERVAQDVGASRASGDEPVGATERFELAGPRGCRATVDRWIDGEGAERLHGEAALRGGSGAMARVVEDVRIDRDGRLLWAHVTTRGDDARRLDLDVEHGVARLTVDRSPVLELALPTDAPWIYASLTDGGIATATPIAAHVAARAALRGGPVRRLDVAWRASHLVVSDQVRIETEAGPVVVLGDDVAELDEAFVARLSLRDAGITLERLAPRTEGDDLACR